MFARRTSWNLSPTPLAQAIESARRRCTLLDLSVSNPTEVGLSYQQDEILGALANEATPHYSPQPQGLLSAREAVAAYYRDFDCSLDPKNIILTASTSEAYSFLFRLLCDPDDEILVPQPSYPLFQFLADLCDVRLVHYPLLYDHGWHLDQHSLSSAITPGTRAIIVVHPNNPTGSYVSPSDRDFLNQIAAQHNLALITDEVFLDYGTPPFTFAANESALTFTLSGLSKISGLPQMKLAWIAASGPPAQLREALARIEVIADTFLSVSTPIQLAAPTLLSLRQKIIAQLSTRTNANLNNFDRELAEFPAISRLNFEAGWYAILRVPATRSDDELAQKLVERCGVIVHPGHLYEFASDGYLVLSLITPEADFTEGIRRILPEIASR
jgi:aspartate/methionine/tyrosine aminotransferase